MSKINDNNELMMLLMTMKILQSSTVLKLLQPAVCDRSLLRARSRRVGRASRGKWTRSVTSTTGVVKGDRRDRWLHQLRYSNWHVMFSSSKQVTVWTLSFSSHGYYGY